MMVGLLRMPGTDGRGPWKPGFSYRWTDESRTSLPESCVSAVPNFRQSAMDWHRKGFNIGCAVRPSRVDRWFSASEISRLATLGYTWHDASRCDVVWENDDQAIIATRAHLRKLPMIEFTFCRGPQ